MSVKWIVLMLAASIVAYRYTPEGWHFIPLLTTAGLVGLLWARAEEKGVGSAN